MTHKFANEINDCPGPPPGAGRTFLRWSDYSINTWYSGYIGWVDHADIRQVAAEHDANTAPSDGDRTGTAFRWRSHRDTLAPLGLGLLIVTVLLYIMAARTFHHADGWRCHPGDRATTNGRELCPPYGGAR